MTEVEAPVDLPLSFLETLTLSERDFAQTLFIAYRV